MPKKVIWIVLSFLVLSFVLTACGGGEVEQPAEEAAPADEVEARIL